jgi:hypothetical protein
MNDRDRGLAFERTSLAWNRTGLASLAAAALCLKVFWDGHPLGLVLAAILAVIGVVAYGAGARPPVTPNTLRAMSLATTAAAVVGMVLSIVG